MKKWLLLLLAIFIPSVLLPISIGPAQDSHGSANREAFDRFLMISFWGEWSSLPVVRKVDPDWTGSYFGQKPPGGKPELFAPGIMTAAQGYHSPIVFSPDLREAVWREMGGALLKSRNENGVWTKPVQWNLGPGFEALDPFFSPDGKRLFFLSLYSELPGEQERERIWFADRESDGWSRPRLIDAVVREHPTHWTLSLALNGNLYFTSEIKGEDNPDIYVAEKAGAAYLPPRPLDQAINSPSKDFCPFIAPDESYLIFSRIGPGTKKSDLFISFRRADGTWTEAVEMGPRVNGEGHDLAPYVSPDGKWLFFISQRERLNGIYWMDAKSSLTSIPSGGIVPSYDRMGPGAV